ncbi:MAG: molybdopterin-binding protein [Rhodospirillales bacterium]|nr:molybdopterin-binding protein [Rhodospirillales bacterium]
MEFGELDTEDALGCILAHSVRLAGATFKKGTHLDDQALAQLKAVGMTSLMVARPQAGDVLEDEAAGRIAGRIAGAEVRVAEPFTGRANIYAREAGVFVADAERIGALNRVDEAMTIATLAPFSRVVAGQMVATVKIIPFMVPESQLQALERLAGDGPADISVAGFRPLHVALIISRLPGDGEKILNKRHQAVAERISSLGGTLDVVSYCDHTTKAVTEAIRQTQGQGSDLILLFGASAIVDRGDVIPAALVGAGGALVHFGMPVDPGNLLLYGKLGKAHVVGVPSCASSIKENGFDWVLERLFAGLALDRDAFIAMACGGLLKEIPSRPQPRERGANAGK